MPGLSYLKLLTVLGPKAWFPAFVFVPNTYTSVSALLFWKANVSIFSTLAGIVIVFRFSHTKAFASITGTVDI